MKKDVNWSNYLPAPPKRKEIDPDSVLSKKEIKLKLRGKGIDVEEPFDISEYPEFLDSGICSLCRIVNKLPFVRTYYSCSGHLIKNLGHYHRGIWVDGENVLEYYEPTLGILLIKDNGKAQQFLGGLKKLCDSWSKPSKHFKVLFEDAFSNFEEVGGRSPVNDGSVFEVRITLIVKVPEEWIRSNNKREANELNGEIVGKTEKASWEEKEALRKQGWYPEIRYMPIYDWSYGSRVEELFPEKLKIQIYQMEHGGYFNSKEVREKIRFFFKRTKKLAENFVD